MRGFKGLPEKTPVAAMADLSVTALGYVLLPPVPISSSGLHGLFRNFSSRGTQGFSVLVAYPFVPLFEVLYLHTEGCHGRRSPPPVPPRSSPLWIILRSLSSSRHSPSRSASRSSTISPLASAALFPDVIWAGHGWRIPTWTGLECYGQSIEPFKRRQDLLAFTPVLSVEW